MAKNRQQLDNELREGIIERISNFLTAENEEVLRTSNTTIAIPTVDSEGNDTYIELAVKIPKGAKIEGGYAGYDGHEVATEYAEDVALKAKQKAESAKNKKSKGKGKTPKAETKEVEEVEGE